MLSYNGHTYVIAAISLSEGLVTLVFPEGKEPNSTIIEILKSASASMKISKPIVLQITIGNRNGYDRKKKRIVLDQRLDKNPEVFRSNFLQIVGLQMWETLSKKKKIVYAKVVKELPHLLGGKIIPEWQKGLNKKIQADFAFAFALYCDGKLKLPRKTYMEAYVNKKYKAWDRSKVRDQDASQMRKHDRNFPTSSREFRPDPEVPERQKAPPLNLLKPDTRTVNLT